MSFSARSTGATPAQTGTSPRRGCARVAREPSRESRAADGGADDCRCRRRPSPRPGASALSARPPSGRAPRRACSWSCPPTPAGAGDAALDASSSPGLPLLRRIALAANARRLRASWCPRAVRSRRCSRARRRRAPARGAAASACAARARRPAGQRRAPAAWLRALRRCRSSPSTLYVDASLARGRSRPKRAAGVLAAAARCAQRRRRSSRSCARTFARTSWPLDPAGRFPLVTAGDDVPRAETWLLRSLIKPSEGLHVAARRAPHLAGDHAPAGRHGRMTPNAMTLVSVGDRPRGRAVLLSAAPALQLAGALLFLTHSILDGCDGELARLKFLRVALRRDAGLLGRQHRPRRGLPALAIGWSASVGAAWPLVLGAVAVAATLARPRSCSRRHRRGQRPAGARGRTVVGALASRDFIYVVVLLAAFGKARWFLVAAPSARRPSRSSPCISPCDVAAFGDWRAAAVQRMLRGRPSAASSWRTSRTTLEVHGPPRIGRDPSLHTATPQPWNGLAV